MYLIKQFEEVKFVEFPNYIAINNVKAVTLKTHNGWLKQAYCKYWQLFEEKINKLAHISRIYTSFGCIFGSLNYIEHELCFLFELSCSALLRSTRCLNSLYYSIEKHFSNTFSHIDVSFFFFVRKTLAFEYTMLYPIDGWNFHRMIKFSNTFHGIECILLLFKHCASKEWVRFWCIKYDVALFDTFEMLEYNISAATSFLRTEHNFQPKSFVFLI